VKIERRRKDIESDEKKEGGQPQDHFVGMATMFIRRRSRVRWTRISARELAVLAEEVSGERFELINGGKTGFGEGNPTEE